MDRVSTSIILFAIGLVTLLTGLLYGFSSQTVAYQHTQQAPVAHFLSSSGVGYIQLTGNSSLYIIHEDDFRPVINENSFGDGDVVSLIYDPTATESIDVSSLLGTHLVGNASKVVEITLLTPNGLSMFVTPDYTQNQSGYNINRWPVGVGIIIPGLLIASLAAYIYTGRKKNRTGSGVADTSQSPTSTLAIPDKTEQEQEITPPDNTSVHP